MRGSGMVLNVPVLMPPRGSRPERSLRRQQQEPDHSVRFSLVTSMAGIGCLIANRKQRKNGGARSMTDYFAVLGHLPDFVLSWLKDHGIQGFNAGAYLLVGTIFLWLCHAVPTVIRMAFFPTVRRNSSFRGATATLGIARPPLVTAAPMSHSPRGRSEEPDKVVRAA